VKFKEANALTAKFEGVIISASSRKILEENLRDLEKGPLPEDVFMTVQEQERGQMRLG
jgi:hypothetical protein